MNALCKHCGEYHSCTDLIDEQADRIAELEKENAELKYEKSSNAFGCPHGVDDGACKECYQEQTSAEPVAWAYILDGGDFMDAIHPEEHNRHEGKYTTPLYTTPHHASDVKQTKPLSDEEIIELAKSCGYANKYEYNIKFARALEKEHGIK